MFVNKWTIFGSTIVSAIVINVYFSGRAEVILYFFHCVLLALLFGICYIHKNTSRKKNLFACVPDIVLLTLSSVSSSSSSSSLSSLLLLLTEAVSVDAVLSVTSELTSTWASAATCCQNRSNTRLDASSDLLSSEWHIRSQSDATDSLPPRYLKPLSSPRSLQQPQLRHSAGSHGMKWISHFCFVSGKLKWNTKKDASAFISSLKTAIWF